MAFAIPCSFFSVSQNFCSSVKYLSNMKTLERPRVAISGALGARSRPENFPYRNLLLNSIDRMFLRTLHKNISVLPRLCVLGALVTALAHLPPQKSAQVRKQKIKPTRNTRAYITSHRGKRNPELHELRT